MKYTKEVIAIIICTILMNSDLLNAQSTQESKRYTGICIDYRANDSFMRIVNMFNDAGYSLGLDGTTQTVRIDVVNFYEIERIPNNAAAIAIGMNNDDGIWIRINSQIWYYMDNDRRDFTLLHELGHDYFNLKHVENEEDLMFPELPRDIFRKDVIKAFNQLLSLCRGN